MRYACLLVALAIVGGPAQAAGLLVPVDEARFGTIAVGKKVTVGIRPHDFAIASAGARVVATFRVEIVEALGFEAFAHGWLTSSGPRVIVRLESREVGDAKARGELPLTVDPARVHLFDEATGLSLEQSV